jgi:hypothetical protein
MIYYQSTDVARGINKLGLGRTEVQRQAVSDFRHMCDDNFELSDSHRLASSVPPGSPIVS